MEYYTIKELSAKLKLHPRTLYAAIRAGDLPASYVGRGWRVSEEQLERWYKAQEQQGLKKAEARAATLSEVYHSKLP